MLQSLHVKNLALMEETEVEFGPGLNILTGETGAGKSLLIGGINLALGGKFEMGSQQSTDIQICSCHEVRDGRPFPNATYITAYESCLSCRH